MKTKFVAILVVQSIAILMFLIFAFYQQTLAERARQEAVENAVLAQKNALMAHKIAEESQIKIAEAERRLEACK